MPSDSPGHYGFGRMEQEADDFQTVPVYAHEPCRRRAVVPLWLLTVTARLGWRIRRTVQGDMPYWNLTVAV